MSLRFKLPTHMHPYFSTESFAAQQSHWKLVYFPETDSTNEQAKQSVLSATDPDSLSGTVFLTDKQTQGKGRRDNQWSSSPGEDLLFTVVIETELPLAQIHKVATTTALALALAIEQEKLGLKPMIKFPNDLYLNQKKTAGILIEQVKQFTLIGVGINVNSQPTLENSTSLIQNTTSTTPISREKLLSTFLSQLTTQLSLCQDHYTSIQKHLQNYDLFYGQKIQFTQDSTTHTGTAKGISSNGYLLVQLDGHHQPTEIHSGHTFRLL